MAAVDYEFPSDKHVTEELRELLGRMLVADPNQRATILEIERHPWFRKDIPPDLDVSNFNANYLRLSDSAEHANTIRRYAFYLLCMRKTTHFQRNARMSLCPVDQE